MLTLPEFEALKAGDEVETHSIAPRLTQTPVILRVKGTAQMEGKTLQADFVATWRGVTLGKWNAKLVNNTIEWSFG
jgi:hypothetical protein